MRSGGWKPFWAALFASLLVLVPLVGGTVLLSRQQLRTQLRQAARSESGVPIQLPKTTDQLTVLLCVSGEQPGFVLAYLNASQNCVHLLSVPAVLTVPFAEEETSLARCYAAAGPARCREALAQVLALPEGTRYLAFSPDVLERIADGCGLSREEWRAAVANSFMVSADNAHAIHPAHPEYADKGEFPVLGGGIVIKYNANQRYTTDAVSGAVFQAICQEAGVPVQRYSNRADLPGGSTLGNISTAHLSVPTVDIGLPQLAMHSVCETAGAADTDYLVKAMTAYFSRDFHRDRDGGIVF